MRQRLGGLRQVRQHARRRQARPAPLTQQRGQIGAVDPVHCHHVVLAFEEVLPDERQRRMRRNREQDPRLTQQLLPCLVIPHRTDLQGDEPVVLAIQRFHDTPLAADSERLEELVSLLDQRRHRQPLSSQTSRSCSSSLTLRRMGPQVEVMSGVRSWRFPLEADRTTVGQAAENDVSLADDPTASHLHAVLERFAAGWCVTDLGSSNGTWVNGERIWSSRRLRHGDEIRLGQTRLIFRDPVSAGGSETEAEDAPPSLTTRERDVLVALCRPLLDRDMFTEPASTRTIAEELVITQAAVKQLANLYDKFGVPSGDSSRRSRLANEALRRGAVSLTQLRAPENQ
jgi:hypothetical protein